MASTVTEQTAIEEIGPGQFRSKVNPGRMGNAKPIAYGGCTLGVAVRAAHMAVPPNHHLYSVVGHYLGPASTTEKLVCIVHDTRTTKSFSTRRVVVQQAQPSGSTTTTAAGEQMRTCMELIADFHAEEPAAPGMTYSAAPSQAYAGPGRQSETPAVLRAGDLSAAETAAVARSRDVFALNERFLETRPCREGVAAQNLNGVLAGRPTTQDARALADRTAAEWVRHKPSSNSNEEGAGLASAADQAAALAFCLDGGLSFLPLTLDGVWLGDVGACSSLDFALRFLAPRPDFNGWHLRERRTVAGEAGRTYSEARMWDEEGNLVAIMSQQSIMRPKPEKQEKGKKEKASRL